MSSYWRGRLLDLGYTLAGLRRRLTAWIPPPVLVRERIAYLSLRGAPGNWPATRWWWFARKDLDRACLVTWRSSWWWYLLRMDGRELRYQTYFWLGVIDGPEGGFYQEHRWCWPWRARYAGWRVPTRTIYTWPVYGEYRLRTLSTREPVTFRKASGAG